MGNSLTSRSDAWKIKRKTLQLEFAVARCLRQWKRQPEARVARASGHCYQRHGLAGLHRTRDPKRSATPRQAAPSPPTSHTAGFRGVFFGRKRAGGEGERARGGQPTPPPGRAGRGGAGGGGRRPPRRHRPAGSGGGRAWASRAGLGRAGLAAPPPPPFFPPSLPPSLPRSVPSLPHSVAGRGVRRRGALRSGAARCGGVRRGAPEMAAAWGGREGGCGRVPPRPWGSGVGRPGRRRVPQAAAPDSPAWERGGKTLPVGPGYRSRGPALCSPAARRAVRRPPVPGRGLYRRPGPLQRCFASTSAPAGIVHLHRGLAFALGFFCCFLKCFNLLRAGGVGEVTEGLRSRCIRKSVTNVAISLQNNIYLPLPCVLLSLPVEQVRLGLYVGLVGGPLEVEEGESKPLFTTKSRRCSFSFIFWKLNQMGS